MIQAKSFEFFFFYLTVVSVAVVTAYNKWKAASGALKYFSLVSNMETNHK